MAERTRRPRVGLAHSSPGASGVTARPNYVGPSGNGLVKRMNAERKTLRNPGRTERAPLSVFRRRSRGLRKNAAVERREANAQRHWACAARRLRCYPRLSALRSPHICEGASPLVSEGMEMPGAPRALREQGRRSFGHLVVSCLKCE